jgi:subtilisin-like proprotein convertase family protein
MKAPAQVAPTTFAGPVQIDPLATYNDPLLSAYWHLWSASGSSKGVNVANVWDDYRGAGVKVAVIDDGIDYLHPDLAPNYDTSLDYDTRNSDFDAYPSDPTDKHGTTVAGVIAAALDNGIGGAGVAPEATLVGYRIGYGSNGSMSQMLAAFQRLSAVDVANNSWGYGGYFSDNFLNSAYAPLGDALQNALDAGRGGLGTVVVFSAGNSRGEGQDVNYHGFQSHRGVVAVAATDSAGNVSSYSTPGAALLVAAPGNGIRTTDRLGSLGYSSGDYATMSGTSFSAPIVSGVVALMLDANPGLGWRDVQEILAATAVRTGSSASWADNGADNWNGGAMHVSHDYGFGLVNAHAAVRVAESWKNQSTSANEWAVTGVGSANALIPDLGSVASTIALQPGLRIDRVEVDIALQHTNIGQLRITLSAPDGTQSVLMHNPATSQSSLYFTFSTTRDWGELSGGNWTLTVTDNQAGGSGTLNTWALRAYGDPAGDDTYVYTNEFGTLAAADATRRMLADPGGVDTINAAAITTDTLLDLRPGYTGMLAGQNLTIAATTTIENADTGDGNDVLIGNAAANLLRGWRGNDLLDGGAGNDTLVGGKGNDTYVVDALGDLIVEQAGSGTDTVRTARASYQLGAELENLVYIGAGSFVATGNALANVLTGGGGSDVFDGAAGADLLIGGLGSDRYYVGAGDTVVEFAGEGTDSVFSGVDWTLGANLERLYLTGNAAVNGTGNELGNTLGGDTNAAGNVLTGGLGNDLYYVGAGDTAVELAGEGLDSIYSSLDWILGANLERLYLTGSAAVNGTGNELGNTLSGYANSAANVLSGGLGNDIYVVGSGDTVLELAGEGSDLVYCYGDYTLAANVENLTLNVATAATLTGNELANTLSGNAGVDTLIGGLGDDGYHVNDSRDDVVEWAGEGTDTVYSSTAWTLGAHLERLYLTGSAAIDGSGNALDNILYGQGNSAGNVLTGRAGNDRYYAGIGDTVLELAGEGSDTIYCYGDYTLSANVENLSLNVSTEATLTGNERANTLRGHAGADTLIGGLGNDILFGGGGWDTFFFDSDFGLDWIRDFTPGQDVIQLDTVLGMLDFSDLDTNGDGILSDGDANVDITGADTWLAFGSEQIRVIGQSNLDSSDFLFV